MAEYVTKEQVIDWYRPYGQTDEPIPFETMVSDLRDMKAADVAPVRHGHWIYHRDNLFPSDSTQECSYCREEESLTLHNENYCPNCGTKMDEVIE